jgi:pullulanase
MARIISAKIQEENEVEICFDQIMEQLDVENVHIDNGIKIHHIACHENFCHLKTSTFDLTKTSVLKISDFEEIVLQPDRVLNMYQSKKNLGCQIESDQTVFRLFAPRATGVKLILFNRFDEETGNEYDMNRDGDGVWEVSLPGKYLSQYYGYRIFGSDHETEMFDSSLILADPYSKAVASKNHYHHPAKTLIVDPSHFNWEGDTWLNLKREDLIIYECHVRNMTVHPSSGVDPEKRGTYIGLVQEGKKGGLDYLRSMGVNAVELLPAQEFANIEIDYKNPNLPIFNNWNSYERNHWGYMTSYFFAPESYYATDGTMEKNQYNGIDGRAVFELKEMVKAFHRVGIAVIMDVVYNHVSQYDFNPLKYIDKKYYFHLNDDQTFRSLSQCGNDFHTQRPMSRRLIVDSIRYWMEEYHIDGFRFDLAVMINEQTIDHITQKAREVNPDVILIAEPWGGGKYDPHFFSTKGWSSWNDWFRKGMKGEHPTDVPGFIFGQQKETHSIEYIQNLICGTLFEKGGPFLQAAHSVNYLECHDNCTLGDFIRFTLNDITEESVVENLEKHIQLTEKQLQYSKLAALILLTSQGVVMIHEGQELGRSKVIAKTLVPDTSIGKIDCNSYNKDDETNWIHYHHADINRELVDYYRGLIMLRNTFTEFRWAKRRQIHFIESETELAFGYLIDLQRQEDNFPLLVLINGDCHGKAEFKLPPGKWAILVDQDQAGIEIIEVISDSIVIQASSGMVLRQQ